MKKIFLTFFFLLGLVGNAFALLDDSGSGGGSGSGDIEGVTAGTNLNGGGTSGSVTLNVDDEITVSTVNVNAINGVGSSGLIAGTTYNTLTLRVSDDGGTTDYDYSFHPSSVTDSNGYAIAIATRTFSINLSSDPTSGFNSLYEPFYRVPEGYTFTFSKFFGRSLPDGATIQYNIEIVADDSLGASGSDVFTVTDSSAVVGSSAETSFSSSTASSTEWLVLTSPSSAGAGSPEKILINGVGFLTKD